MINLSYTVFNIKSIRSVSEMRAIQNERIRAKEYVNVISEKSANNCDLTSEQDIVSLYEQALKSDYYSKPDKSGRFHKEPRVKAVNIILSYSHDAEIEKNEERFERWINKNLEFINEIFINCPKAITLHMDETAPHIHVAIIPVTPSGKISKNAFIRNKYDLYSLHDKYAERMKEFGLARGERCERNSHDRKTAVDEYRELIDKNAKLKQENNDLDIQVKMNKEELSKQNKNLEQIYSLYEDEREKYEELREEIQDGVDTLNAINQVIADERRAIAGVHKIFPDDSMSPEVFDQRLKEMRQEQQFITKNTYERE